MSNHYLIIYHNQKGVPHLRSQHNSLRQAKGFLERNPQLKDFTIYKVPRFPKVGENLDNFMESIDAQVVR
jgi:hypothetical protein